MSTNEELVARFQSGDESALVDLFAKNSGLIHKMIGKYRRHAEQECDEDLEQVAQMAIWKAAKAFDSSKGFKFISFVWRAVENSVRKEIDNHSTIYCSTTGFGSDPKHIKKAKRDSKRLGSRAFRIDKPAPDGERQFELASAPERNNLEDQEYERIREWALSRLPEREATIVEMRLREDTLEAVGKVIGVSRERARQIEGRAMAGFRALITASYNPPRHRSLTGDERAYVLMCAPFRTVGAMARDLRRADATVKRLLKSRRALSNRFGWLPSHREFLSNNRHRGWQWCAGQLGITVKACRSQARRWGLSKKHLTNFTGLKQHYDAGLTTREIGERLGVSDECIRINLIEMGLASPGRNERWRNSQKRRDACREVHKKKKAIHRKRATELGYPTMHYSHAVILAALHTIGSGDRDAVAEACRAVCRSHGWKEKFQRGLSVLNYTTELTRRGLIRSDGKGNQRRIFSLAIPAAAETVA